MVSLVSNERRMKVHALNNDGKSDREVAEQLGISEDAVAYDKEWLRKNNYVIVDARTYRWDIAIKNVAEILDSYFTPRGITPTLRTMFYRLVSLNIIQNTSSDYTQLSRCTRDARKGCDQNWNKTRFPKLEINCFIDEVRESYGNYDDSEPEDPEPPDDPENPEEYIDSAIQTLKDAPDDYDGKVGEGTEETDPGRWYNQPKYVEVWIEKGALKGTFEHFLQDKGVKLVVNRGYSSLTFMYENCVRLSQVDEDKEIWILYCGDMDPSGYDIDRAIKKEFEFYAAKFEGFERLKDTNFKRIAITPKQVQEYGIPSALEGNPEALEKFLNDSRHVDYEAEYGRVAYEVDALLAYDADKFEKLIQDEVDDCWNEDIYDEYCPQTLQELENELGEKGEWPEEIDIDDSYEGEKETHREMMLRKINEAFKPGWENE